MRSGFKLLNLFCINVKKRKIGFNDASSHLDFLLNKQYINHIDDYIANYVDDLIDIAPFLDFHKVSLKEKQFIFNVKTLFTLTLQFSKGVFLINFSHFFVNIIKDGGRNEHITSHSEPVV